METPPAESRVIVLNGRERKEAKSSCFYCLNLQNEPSVHLGYFVNVPTRFWMVWKKAIEKAIGRKMPSYFEERVRDYNCRVSAAVHLCITGNGDFDIKKPLFKENTHLWGPEYLLTSLSRSQSAAFHESLKWKKELEEKEKIEEEIKKLDEKKKKKVRRMEDMAESFLFIEENIRAEPVLTCSNVDVSLASKMEPELRKTSLFNEDVRMKVRDRYCLGTSLKGIEMQLEKEYLERSPCLTSIWRMVQEGRHMANAVAAQLISKYYMALSLGSDESSCRHRSILVVNAIGENKSGKHMSCVLGLVHLVGKDEATITKAICCTLQKIKETAEALPSFHGFSLAVDLNAFIGYSSDHLNTNGAVVRKLNEMKKENNENADVLTWIRCIMHKYNLIEDHICQELKRNRAVYLLLNQEMDAENLSPEDQIMLDIKGGMKASTGNNIHSASDFLYRLSKILADRTSGEKANWGELFNHWMDEAGKPWRMKPIDGKRLHIYSHSSLRTYWVLSDIATFVRDRNPSWTKTYLLESLGSQTMVSEMRILGYYG